MNDEGGGDEGGIGGIAARSSSRGRGIGSVFTSHSVYLKVATTRPGKSRTVLTLNIDGGKVRDPKRTTLRILWDDRNQIFLESHRWRRAEEAALTRQPAEPGTLMNGVQIYDKKNHEPRFTGLRGFGSQDGGRTGITRIGRMSNHHCSSGLRGWY